MQILEIILYSRSGKSRILPFKPGKVNIIIGKSGRGKTAIISVVTYCLGSPECHVPEGDLRDAIGWYALKLQLPDAQILIAREAPEFGGKSNLRAYIEVGSEVLTPKILPVSNTDITSACSVIEKRLGIGGYIHIPPVGQTRDPLKPTLRHTLSYCFQRQTEIASNEVLFHGHVDNWTKMAAVDTLPYFLGVFREDQLALESQLRELKRAYKKYQRALAETSQIQGEGASTGIQLLAEARQVGIIEEGISPKKIAELKEILSCTKTWQPKPLPIPEPRKLFEIQTKISQLEKLLSEKDEELEAARTYSGESLMFQDSSAVHRQRLESVNLFKNQSNEDENCPLCRSPVKIKIASIDQIKRSVLSIQSSLENIEKERPQLSEFIFKLEAEREELSSQLEINRQIVRGMLDQSVVSKKIRDEQIQASIVIGRISLWLDSIDDTDELASIRSNISTTGNFIAELEERIDGECLDDRLDLIRNRITDHLTSIARKLKLEYSENPVKLDLKKLTVIADRKDRSIELLNMGSAKNWLGYHLAALFALHGRFIEAERPVPRFLILDQPSQVFFTRENFIKAEGDFRKIQDVDRETIKKIYHLLFDETDALNGNFQVIVADHADLEDARFKAHVVESWWDDNALVPDEWLKS